MRKISAVYLACLTMLAGCAAQTTKGQSGGLFPILENGKWGYIDRTGQVVIEPEFDYASDFSEGLAMVSDGGLPAYIDRTGKRIFTLQVYGRQTLSPNQFLYPNVLRCPSFSPLILGFIDGCPDTHFSEGLARILVGGRFHEFRLDGGQVGFIDKKGEVAIQPQFAGAWGYSEGLALALMSSSGESNRDFGYIDYSGATVIPPQFRRAAAFSEGLAKVAILDDPEVQSLKYGYVDKTGKMAIQPQFSAAHSFSEGLASVQKDGKYGYIDPTGQFVIQPQFDSAAPFSEGLALVQMGPSSDRQFGYVDRLGRMVIRLHDLKSVPCSEGDEWWAETALWFGTPQGGASWASTAFMMSRRQAQSQGFRTGPLLPPPGSFSEGLAGVRQLSAGSCGYIDKTGQLVIKPQFSAAGSFREGLAYVESSGLLGRLRFGYIDKTGKRVWKARLEKRNGDASALALQRWGEAPAPRLRLTAKEKAVAEGGEITSYRFEIANREAYPNEVFELSPDLDRPDHTRMVVGFYAVPGGHQLGEFVSVRSKADLDRIWTSVERDEQPPRQVFIKFFDQQLHLSKSSGSVDVWEKSDWQIFNDSHSRFVENSQFDLTQTAVRRQTADSVEFRITFRQAVPKFGHVTLWVDTDRSPDTGENFWGDIGADRVIAIPLARGQAKVSAPGQPAKENYRILAEKSGNQILVKVQGWETDDFDFVVMQNAGPTNWVELSYTWSADGCDITVDGQIGDWADRKPIWTSPEPELPPAVALADLRKVWLCNREETLFGRVEFPSQHALYGDHDVSDGEPSIDMSLERGTRSYRFQIATGTTYRLGAEGGLSPSDFVMKSNGPDMEFRIENVGSPLLAPGGTRDITIHTLMQKLDFIPDTADSLKHLRGHLEFRSGGN